MPSARTTASAADARAAAYRALDAAQAHPARAGCDAASLRAHPDPEARAVARWAQGRSAYELGRLDDALAHLRAAARLAARHHLAEVATQVRLSLAALHLARGRTAVASRLVERAVREATSDRVRGRALSQRCFLRYQLGRGHEAVRDADQARRLLERDGDELGLARLLINRGIVRLSLGDLDGAEADLRACGALARALDQTMIVGASEHDLAFLLGRRGRIPEALHHYELARASYAALGDPGRALPLLDADISETLLAAGLAGDAADAAMRALARARASGDRLQEAEARLRLARALLAADRHAEAAQEAGEALRLCRRTGRTAWAALADYLALEAALAGDPAAGDGRWLRRARHLVGVLEAHRWRQEAAALRVSAARVAAAAGRRGAAIELLAGVGRARSPLEAVHRAYAVALTYALAGDHRRSAGEAGRGLAVLARYRDTVGSTELRVSASALGAQLVQLGLRDALRRGRPVEVLRWAERLRAVSASATSTPVVPATAVAHDDRQVLDPRSAWPSEEARDQVERRVLERARRSHHSVPASTGRRPGLSPPPGRALVSYSECDGRLVAVVHDGRWRLVALGPVAAVATELAHLRSTVRRSLVSEAACERTAPARRRAAEALAALVWEPLGLAAGPVTIVPAAALAVLPWALLPPVAEVAHVVAPGLRLARPPSGRAGDGTAVLVGPGLDAGEAEAAAIAAADPGAVVHARGSATVAAVVDALRDADVVHLAAHGTFRAGRPLLSSFLLADGPLTLLDLEQVPCAARVVVTSACHGGATSAHPADDTIGMAATMLGRGAGAVVAPVTAVPDAAVVVPMAALHAALRAGAPCDVALASARAAADPGVAAVALATFTCFGSPVALTDG